METKNQPEQVRSPIEKKSFTEKKFTLTLKELISLAAFLIYLGGLWMGYNKLTEKVSEVASTSDIINTNLEGQKEVLTRLEERILGLKDDVTELKRDVDFLIKKKP